MCNEKEVTLRQGEYKEESWTDNHKTLKCLFRPATNQPKIMLRKHGWPDELRKLHE